MGRQERRRTLTTRRPKELDAALGVTMIWLGFAAFFFVAGGFAGRANPAYISVPLALALLAWGWAIHTIRARNAAGKGIEELRALSPDQFEEWVAARFRDLGYAVKVTGAGGDHGIDLVAEKAGETAVVQCKNYKSWSVGEPVLRDLFGAMHDFRANRAYLATTGRLTRPAAEWVTGKPIEIWDADYLGRLSKRLASKAAVRADDDRKTALPSLDGRESTAGTSNDMQRESSATGTIACPKCGSNLVEKRNRRTGELFLACPGFPDCRHTQPLE